MEMIGIFIFQMFVMYPLFAILMGKRLKAHFQKQLEWKREQLQKTVKGRMRFKLEKKVKKSAQPVVLDKL